MRRCRLLVLALTLTLAGTAPAATRAEDTERLLRQLQDPSTDVRRNGAMNVGNAAGRGRDTTPRLLEMLATETDPSVREMVVRALGLASKGMAGVPQAVVKVLGDDPDPKLRERAADALAELAEAPELAMPALAKALADPEVEVRRKAAVALGKFPGQAAAVAPLQKALEDASIAWPAAAALGELGPVAAPAVPSLRQLVAARETDDGVRVRALRALLQIGEAAKDATPECLQLLAGNDARLRVEAAAALLAFGRETGPAMRVVNASLGFTGGAATSDAEFERQDVISRAAWAADKFAALADGDTVARLAVAAEDRDRDIRRWAAPAFDTVLKVLVRQRRFDALDSMIDARDFLAGSNIEPVRNRSRSVAAAVAELEAAQPLGCVCSAMPAEWPRRRRRCWRWPPSRCAASGAARPGSSSATAAATAPPGAAACTTAWRHSWAQGARSATSSPSSPARASNSACANAWPPATPSSPSSAPPGWPPPTPKDAAASTSPATTCARRSNSHWPTASRCSRCWWTVRACPRWPTCRRRWRRWPRPTPRR